MDLGVANDVYRLGFQLFRVFVPFVKLNHKSFFAQWELEMLARGGRNSRLALL